MVSIKSVAPSEECNPWCKKEAHRPIAVVVIRHTDVLVCKSHQPPSENIELARVPASQMTQPRQQLGREMCLADHSQSQTLRKELPRELTVGIDQSGRREGKSSKGRLHAVKGMIVEDSKHEFDVLLPDVHAPYMLEHLEVDELSSSTLRLGHWLRRIGGPSSANKTSST